MRLSRGAVDLLIQFQIVPVQSDICCSRSQCLSANGQRDFCIRRILLHHGTQLCLRDGGDRLRAGKRFAQLQRSHFVAQMVGETINIHGIHRHLTATSHLAGINDQYKTFQLAGQF